MFRISTSTDRARDACRVPRNLSGIAKPFGETPRPSSGDERTSLGQQGLDGPSGQGVGGRAQSSPLKKTGAVKELCSREQWLCIGPPPTRRELRDETSYHQRQTQPRDASRIVPTILAPRSPASWLAGDQMRTSRCDELSGFEHSDRENWHESTVLILL
jgi:hypothetical protein